MPEISFKERVRNELITGANLYKQYYVDYEYLVFSEAFTEKPFYIIDANPDNFAHLTGVNILVSAQEFFNKCYNGTLQESDFDFSKKGQSEKSVKGCVREKISVLQNMSSIFYGEFLLQETFSKNKVTCSIASSDNKCTLGFIDASKSRPKSLLKGNELELSKARKASLLLRKHKSKDKFDELLIGDNKALGFYFEHIKEYAHENLIKTIKSITENNKAV